MAMKFKVTPFTGSAEVIEADGYDSWGPEDRWIVFYTGTDSRYRTLVSLIRSDNVSRVDLVPEG